MKPKPGVALNEVTKISLSHHDDSIVVIHNSVSRAHVLNLAPAVNAGGNNNNVPHQAEKYSGFVVVLTEAIKKAKVSFIFVLFSFFCLLMIFFPFFLLFQRELWLRLSLLTKLCSTERKNPVKTRPLRCRLCREQWQECIAKASRRHSATTIERYNKKKGKKSKRMQKKHVFPTTTSSPTIRDKVFRTEQLLTGHR
jgi:hypothetical protein